MKRTAIKFSVYMLMLRLVHHVLKKPDDSRGKFTDMNQIGHQFISDLVALVDYGVQPPWAGEDTSAKTKHANAPSVGVSVFSGDAVSNSAELLAERGFMVDKLVTSKTVDGVWQITAMDTCVHLTCNGLDLHLDIHKFSSSVQTNEWKIAKPMSAIIIMQDWRERAHPLESVDFEQKCVESRMVLALRALQKRHEDIMNGIDPLIDANGKLKGVQVNRDFAPNELVLVPLTDSIICRKPNVKDGSGLRTKNVVNDPRCTYSTLQVCVRFRMYDLFLTIVRKPFPNFGITSDVEGCEN